MKYNNLKLYKVNTEYIDYLKQFQKHMWDNDDKGYTLRNIAATL